MKEKSLEFFKINTINAEKKIIPFVGGIQAGFPSAADDFYTERIDLNKELIKDPETTFLARVRGDSMKDMRIFNGDLILVDRSLEPKDGNIAVCYIDGEFTLKKLKIIKQEGKVTQIHLLPQNPAYDPIIVTPENEFIIWGILTYNITHYL
ncbi:translesion error-prone DNA polymerase V autoproteolytic subunit [Apibacter muscae]|uniref:Translesion error-prone DNA polymerase V autoproteolytic subunit n=1 Tax=Apibacter muscae TaxID=2509004 RepID=A0A563DGJ1_9FLAO|nr:translesion error-prone DNA polymerase V autoproteolytic subunit [Apibacter muscae]TWP29151.1 translesion error-prone DNA polymerase V autoproteolytic subunit [Apibacter muscae]